MMVELGGRAHKLPQSAERLARLVALSNDLRLGVTILRHQSIPIGFVDSMKPCTSKASDP